MTTNQKRDKNDLLGVPFFKFLFKNKIFLFLLKITVLSIFMYAIFLGFFEQDSTKNTFTKAVFWTLFWPFFVIVTLSSFGRLFCGICPHGFIGKYITKFGLKKKIPKAFANPFIGVVLLFFGIWVVYYINPATYKSPLASAIVFSFMTLLALFFFYMYKDMAYCKSICPVGTLMRVYSKISFTWLGTYSATCKECGSFECEKACPYALKPFSFDNKKSMDDCTLCMDCVNACEAVSFKVKKPSSSLFKKFKPRKVEVWAVLAITAAITITMSFHHALSRVAISDTYLWSKMGVALENIVGISGVDYIGVSALILAVVSVVFFAVGGMYLASKLLHVEFSKAFYTLGYAFIPIFIIGGLSHSYEFFFIHYFHDIANGFINGFGLNIQEVAPLASRKDKWLKIFTLINYIAVLWALIIMYKRINFFSGSKLKKMFAFIFASSLILFYLYLNIYKAYAFATYGAKRGGHSHGNNKEMFQSVPVKEATLLQKGKDKISGVVCGMNLARFYKTNYSAKLDGKVRQYCSIHCLIEDMKINKLPLTDIKVVDVKSLKFVDAEKAFYVVGSKKPSTMGSVTSKYAFKNSADAQEFAIKNQGEIKSFDEALNIALKDFK